jgi:peptidoglycan hydrolase-like protein with peptidoglycan-binding domain
MNAAFALPMRVSAPTSFGFSARAASGVPARNAATRPYRADRPRGDVRWLQRSLNRALGLQLRVTGILDAPWRSALRSFQRQQGLTPGGRAGPETYRALVEFNAFAPIQDGEIDQFLGKLAKRVSRAASGVAKGVGSAAKSVGQAATTVAKVVPLSQLADAAARANPLSTAVRAAWGGVSAGLAGKNVLGGALRAAMPTPLARFGLDAGRALLRGENLAKAMKKAAGAGINDVREQMRFVQMVAPFVPGVGQGVGAALGAAGALAEGKPITEAMVAAARGALPGGALAQGAFDTAVSLAQGRSLSAAALDAARKALPGGALARAAFDTAVAIAEGKRLQDAALNAATKALPGGPAVQMGFKAAVDLARGKDPGDALLAAARDRLPNATARAAFDATVAVAQGKPAGQALIGAAGKALPGAAGKAGLGSLQGAVSEAAAKVMKASPYAADALSFAKTASRGQNIQTAALSSAGKQVLARVAR